MKLFIRSIWPSSPRWLWPLLKSNHKSWPNMEDTIYTSCVCHFLRACVCVCTSMHAPLRFCAFVATCLYLRLWVSVGNILLLFPSAVRRDLRWSSQKMETRERRTTPYTSPVRTLCAKSQLRGVKTRRLDSAQTRDRPCRKCDISSVPLHRVNNSALVLCVTAPGALTLNNVASRYQWQESRNQNSILSSDKYRR